MARPIIRSVLTAVICCQVATPQRSDSRSAFEAASVKPAPPYHGEDTSPRGGPGTRDPGQVTYPRVWLPGLVAEAYGVRADQVSGPDWIQSEAYSIIAKLPPGATKQEFNQMLRNLLAERFHLTLRHEPKAVSVYIVSVASGGPKLKPSPADPNAPVALPGSGSGGESRFPPLSAGRTEAHWWRDRAYYTYRQTMTEFALGLGALIHMSNGDGIVRGSRPMPFVVDETALEGRFDFTLEFAGSPLPSPAGGAPPVGGPTIFKALEQQLGLKLDKGKRVVDFLVIEHADRIPTEN